MKQSTDLKVFSSSKVQENTIVFQHAPPFHGKGGSCSRPTSDFSPWSGSQYHASIPGSSSIHGTSYGQPVANQCKQIWTPLPVVHSDSTRGLVICTADCLVSKLFKVYLEPAFHIIKQKLSGVWFFSRQVQEN